LFGKTAGAGAKLHTKKESIMGGLKAWAGVLLAAGLEVDVTTADEVSKKQALGKNYAFVLYTRKLKINADGHAVKL
jgi:hypothetical protein